MRALFTVFGKEFLENLRDRRTLLSALLLGPLLGPLLFGAMVSRMLDQSVAESDEPLKITLSGAEQAPNLRRYLESQGVTLALSALSENAARAAVRSRAVPVVVIVPADYAQRFASGVPAPLLLVADSSDAPARKIADRVRQLLANYGSGIAQLRLRARGVNPLIAAPVAVNEIDVTTPTGRAVAVLGFMTYFVLFAVLMGGLYLAIDSTAGERERGSLEALLSLPVDRAAIVGGKILATCAYMCLSLAISLTAFVVVWPATAASPEPLPTRVAKPAIVCWEDQRAAVEPIASGNVRRNRICAARGWRWRQSIPLPPPGAGAMAGAAACWEPPYRLRFYGPWIAESLAKCGGDAALLVDPSAGLVDPRLVDSLIEHARAHEEIDLCFSPARRGYRGC